MKACLDDPGKMVWRALITICQRHNLVMVSIEDALEPPHRDTSVICYLGGPDHPVNAESLERWIPVNEHSLMQARPVDPGFVAIRSPLGELVSVRCLTGGKATWTQDATSIRLTLIGAPQPALDTILELHLSATPPSKCPAASPFKPSEPPPQNRADDRTRTGDLAFTNPHQGSAREFPGVHLRIRQAHLVYGQNHERSRASPGPYPHKLDWSWESSLRQDCA
jgi:hypothetical protein